MTNLTIDVQPRGIASAYIEAPFDKAKEALEKEAYKIISLEQNAQLRIQEGKDSFVSRNGNYTREGVIYVPKKGIFLTKNSPIMENPKEATDCHRNSKEFYVDDAQFKEALKDYVELPDKNIEIPTNRFGDAKITVWAFGDIAEQYGKFLKDTGIKKMSVLAVDKDYVNEQDKLFARQLWFRSLDYRSDVSGNYGNLYNDYRVRGVREGAEGTAQKIEPSYNIKQIQKALDELGFSGVKEGLLRKLNQ